MAFLQLALDLVELERALKIAREARDSVDWIEVGTPLIKSKGLDAVRAVRKEFQDKVIVADMKIMDTGALEVEIAAKAGADVVTIMGAADTSTIREGIEAGKRFGAKVMIDTMGISNEKLAEIDKLKPDYLCVHVGIDQQMRGVKVLELVKSLRVRTPIAIAGRLDKDTVGEAVRSGAQVVIVGGGITKAPDAKKAAIEIKKAMKEKKRGVKEKEGVEELLKEVSTCNISDGMQRKGEMSPFAVVLNAGLLEGKKIIGRAITVRTMDGDWAKPVEAIDIANKDSILVIEEQGGERAVFGGLAAESCVQRGVKAVIIDGAVRDKTEIGKAPVLVLANRLTPTAGEADGFGEINVDIKCNGARVQPNDLIVIDGSGVVVIPKGEEIEVINRAKDIKEKENRIRAEIRKGSTLSKVLKLKKWELKYKGIG